MPMTDEMPGWLVLVGTVVAFLIVAEVGFRVGRRRPASAEASSPSAVVLGGLLALLGLLLAFNFSIVETRYATKRALVLEEANAVGTTYLRARMLPEPNRRAIQRLLREYVAVRLDSPSLRELLAGSRRLHAQLWNETTRVGRSMPSSEVVALFIESLNNVIDLHQSRVTIGFYARLRWPIVATLFAVSFSCLAMLGYQTGLLGRRGLPSTLALTLAIAAVITIIIELDRPMAPVFRVNQRPIEDVRALMADPELAAELDRRRARRP